MADSKPLSPLFPCLASLLLLSLLLPFLNLLEAKQGEAHDHDHPFRFLHQLVGCEKGANTTGLSQLKQYLSRFGYLNYPPGYYSTANVNEADSFDDILESAIKKYQLNHNLKVTGKLDSETANQMMKPRCGVPDIINGTTSMTSGKRKASWAASTFRHTVMHYSFNQGNSRWPPSKSHLMYAFLNNAAKLQSVSQSAFAKWQSVTQFTFEEVQDYNDADINIGFFRGDHGDGYNFDGQHGILAHAFYPTSGQFHLDADERWSISDNPVAGTTDLETVALHEIGHLLGLGHSSVYGAVMYPTIEDGVILRDLHKDDIDGIQDLYNP